VNTKDITQVDHADGQNIHLHFATVPEMFARIKATTGGVWYVQTRDKQPVWGNHLLQKYSAEGNGSLSGDFKLWRIKG